MALTKRASLARVVALLDALDNPPDLADFPAVKPDVAAAIVTVLDAWKALSDAERKLVRRRVYYAAHVERAKERGDDPPPRNSDPDYSQAERLADQQRRRAIRIRREAGEEHAAAQLASAVKYGGITEADETAVLALSVAELAEGGED